MERTSIKSGGALQLVKSFIALLLENDYSKISIKEISKSANFNRTSFYLFFESKDDLAEYICSTFLDEYTDIMIKSFNAEKSDEVELLIKKAFQFIDRNKTTILGLWSVKETEFSPYLIMQESIETSVRECLKSKNKNTSTNVKSIDFYSKLYAANAMATVKWWLESKEQHTYDYISKVILDCCNEGLNSLLL